MATVESQTYTPEDLLTMPDGDRYELVDGQLVEQTMSLQSAWVAGQVYRLIDDYAKAHKAGIAYPDGATYQCFGKFPLRVRKPDASFIAKGGVTDEEFDEGHCLVAPDLVVEVVSPRDLYYDIQQKVDEYRSAGVRLIWVFNPQLRTVTVYRGNGEVIELRDHEELTGYDVLPSFRCNISELFPSVELAKMFGKVEP